MVGMETLTDRERGILTSYRFLKANNTPVPESLELEVMMIKEAKPWIEKVGYTLITGPIGPFG